MEYTDRNLSKLNCGQSIRLLITVVVLTVLALYVTPVFAGASSQKAHKHCGRRCVPVFTSTPPTAAAQDQLYSYTVSATDPAKSPITFSLTSAPVGATLNGSTLTWTPTAEQARQNNGFSIKATSARGGTATQSWSVAPTGTVQGSLLIMHWSADGSVGIEDNPVQYPYYSWAALVPQPDGSLSVLPGTGYPDATFQVPNVPAGYYWLQFQPGDVVWTNASNLDYGADAIGHKPLPITTQVFGCNITGLDPFDPNNHELILFSVNAQAFAAGVEDQVPGDPPPAPFPTAGSTICNADPMVGFNGGDFGAISGVSGISPSLADVATTEQFEAAPSGTLANPFSGFVIGPAFNQGLDIEGNYQFPFPTFIVPGTLTRTLPSTQDFNITFSAWANEFNSSGPSPAAVPVGFAIELSAQQQAVALPRQNPWLSGASPNLAAAISNGSWPNNTWPADGDFGTLDYNNPFTVGMTANFSTVYEIYAAAQYSIPLPGSATPLQPILQDVTWTPTQPAGFAPVLQAVGNPRINGTSLFTATTVPSVSPTLTWSAPPSNGTVIYTINICAPVQSSDCSNPFGNGVLYSFSQYNQTSFTIPAGILNPGTSYLFFIEAESRADYDPLHPERFSLPWASAWSVSNLITVSSAATPGVVNGDRSLLASKPGHIKAAGPESPLSLGTANRSKHPSFTEWSAQHIVRAHEKQADGKAQK